jgi:dTDP-4-amino-4,6-dideoxygalactose transaminase
MKKIHMVDLLGQYNKIKTEVDKAIMDVISSTAFINGPEVKAFQHDLEKYLGINHVIPCANGTDALQIAFMALGLKPDDEVITADFTYVATAEVIALLQLKPVLVDVLPDTFTLDPLAVEKAITPKTKAIVPVHLFGQCADMDAIMEIAAKYKLYVIEDNAQAIGADFHSVNGNTVKAGTIGTIGCTSFFPSKNLGCYGDGGAIFTHDDALASKLRMIVNHGQSVQYFHDEVGVNSRLDSIQAAILRIKLKHLDQYAEARRKVADKYDKAFKGHPNLDIPVRYEKSSHVFHQYTLKLKNTDRDELRKYLSSFEIPAMIYYPVPLHLQKAYRDERYSEGSFPVTETLCRQVLSLPIHTEMTDEIQDFIITKVLDYFKR